LQNLSQSLLIAISIIFYLIFITAKGEHLPSKDRSLIASLIVGLCLWKICCHTWKYRLSSL